MGEQGENDLLDAGGDGRIVVDDLPAVADHSQGHLEGGRNSRQVMAHDEVPVLRQASESFSHPLLGVLLNDAHVAQAVAFALLHYHALFHQLL